MLDNILDLVKSVAGETINKSADVPSEKKGLAIETASSAIMGGLTNNISGLAGLLGSGGSNSNSIVGSITNGVVSSLADKIGISPTIAKELASSIVPSVINSLSNESNGLSIESIIGALGGGGEKKGKSCPIVKAISSLFGK